jgi:Na+/alanine symporter
MKSVCRSQKECTFTCYSVLYLNIKLDPFMSTVSICSHDSSLLLLSGIGSQNQMQTKVLYVLDDVFTVGVGELGSNGIHLCMLLFLNIV